MRRNVLRFAVLALLPSLGCAQERQELLRAQILRTAQRYATFEWRATKANILHGNDADGVHVDTPDRSFDDAGWVAGSSGNRGMPYAWGGFTSVEEFTQGLGKGMFAGLVPTSERARASRFAMGVDCSGYVTRCLDIPVKQTTRSLARLCYELDGYEQLQPCDLLNQPDGHVALFVSWVDDSRQRMRVLEAARLGVKETIYPADAARREGFVALRYRLLDRRWTPMEAQALGKAKWQPAPSTPPAKFVAHRGAVPSEADTHPLSKAVAGSWARYAIASRPATGTDILRTLFAAAANEDSIEMQCTEIIARRPLPTGWNAPRGQDVTGALVDILAFYEPLQIRRVVEHTVEMGVLTHGDRQFPARRHTWQLEGTTVVRHQEYPMWLDVTAAFSDDVPLYGLVCADFELAVDWRLAGRRSDATLHRESVTLAAFGSAF